MDNLCVKDIVNWFRETDIEVVNETENSSQSITHVRNLEEADSEAISFATEKFRAKIHEVLNRTDCKLLILSDTLYTEIREDLPTSIVYAISPNPKGLVIEFCKKFLDFGKENTETSIHQLSSVAPDVKLGQNVVISQFVVIESGCVIGDNCTIGPNSVLKKGTFLGNNIKIGANNVIGGTGFGYSKLDGAEEYTQFPHLGKVIIKDDVEIGNNTCIDRGSLSDTVISEGVKIDNLVHIAHNVKIGKNSLIIACSMIAGSVTIGENNWVAPNSNIKNGLSLGDNTTIGIAATVTKSYGNDELLAGSPAVPLAEFKLARAMQKSALNSFKKDQNT